MTNFREDTPVANRELATGVAARGSQSVADLELDTTTSVVLCPTPDLDALKAEITRPDQARYLEPLRRFRGSLSPYMAAARWNFVNAMFLAECPDLSTGAKMFAEGEIAHICGNHAKTIGSTNLGFFFNRLRLSPKVCAMVPGLHDYVCCLNRWDFDLEVCGVNVALRSKNAKVVKLLRQASPDSANAFYPFVSKSHNHDCELLARIHAMVPKKINHRIRGDLCQDLVVSVLAGDIAIDEIPNFIVKHIRAAEKFIPRAGVDSYHRDGVCDHQTSIDVDDYGDIHVSHTSHRADHLHSWQELWKGERFVDERTWNQKIACLRDTWGAHE